MPGQGKGEIDLEDRSDSLNIEFMIIIKSSVSMKAFTMNTKLELQRKIHFA